METVIAVEDLKKTYQPKARKGQEVKALDGLTGYKCHVNLSNLVLAAHL